MGHVTTNSTRRRQSEAQLMRTAAEAVIAQSSTQAIIDYAMALQAFDLPGGQSAEVLSAKLSVAEDRLIRTPGDAQAAAFKLQQMARTSAETDGSFDAETAFRWVSDPSICNEERLLASAWLDITAMDRKAWHAQTSTVPPASTDDAELFRLISEHQAIWDEAEASPIDTKRQERTNDRRWGKAQKVLDRIEAYQPKTSAGLTAKASHVLRWAEYTACPGANADLSMCEGVAASVLLDVVRLGSAFAPPAPPSATSHTADLIAAWKAQELVVCAEEKKDDLDPNRRGAPNLFSGSEQTKSAAAVWEALTVDLTTHVPASPADLALLVDFYAEQSEDGSADIKIGGRCVWDHLKRAIRSMAGLDQTLDVPDNWSHVMAERPDDPALADVIRVAISQGQQFEELSHVVHESPEVPDSAPALHFEKPNGDLVIVTRHGVQTTLGRHRQPQVQAAE